MFHVGQKVVCVDDAEQPRFYNEIGVVKGRIYTIRGFTQTTQALMLEEIVNPPHFYVQGFHECGYKQTRFRPVKTTSIAVFEQILKSVPAPRERERA